MPRSPEMPSPGIIQRNGIQLSEILHHRELPEEVTA
jgi:hypothetical protein